MGQRLNLEIIQKGKTVANVYMHWSAYTTSSKNILSNIVEGFEDLGIDENSPVKEIVIALMKILGGAKPVPEEARKLGIVKSTKIKDYYSEDYEELFKKYPWLDIDVQEINSDFFDMAKNKMSQEDYNELLRWSEGAKLNRNVGIISTTEEGIENTRSWEEGRIEYNLDNDTVYFGVYFARDKEDVILDNENLDDKNKEYIFEGDNIFYQSNNGKRRLLPKYHLSFDWQDNITLTKWRQLSEIIDESMTGSSCECVINNQIVSWIE